MNLTNYATATDDGRDLITEEHFNILYGPWAEVIEATPEEGDRA